MRSLHARLLLGAVCWTIGLVIVATAMLTMAFDASSDFRRFIAIHGFFQQPLVLIFAVLAMVAGVFQVRRGLSGIAQLRGRLAALHDGRQQRVEGRYVPEVQPLVEDLNVLLEHQEQAVRRAVAKAGDLAHGLKTPLAVLAREAERAEAAGALELAAAVAQQVERMRRQVDYHLAHARAAASGAIPGARSSVREAVDGLVRTLQQLYADRGLSIEVLVSPSHVVRVQREDMEEMLGNLLDNACKWTKTRVVVDSVERENDIVLTVDDDGAGLPAPMRDAVLVRGVRADEREPGSGFGLAIVRDVAELYHGAIALESSPLGGVRAKLTLPRG